MPLRLGNVDMPRFIAFRSVLPVPYPQTIRR